MAVEHVVVVVHSCRRGLTTDRQGPVDNGRRVLPQAALRALTKTLYEAELNKTRAPDSGDSGRVIGDDNEVSRE
jgi:hypothetical protein